MLAMGVVAMTAAVGVIGVVWSTGSSGVTTAACTTSGRFDASRLPSAPSRQWAADGTVYAILPCGDTVYVGGDFSMIGPLTGSFASVSPLTGLADEGMPVLEGDVASLAADGDGGWLVGTGPDNPQVCAPLLRVRRSGSIAWSIDACAAKQQGSGATIHALARSGSTVYVGGLFATLGGAERLNAAAVDVDSGRVLPWDPEVGGTPVYDRNDLIPREVNAIEVDDGRVYSGGFFNRVGGTRRVNLAVVDAATGQPTGPNLLDFGSDYAAVGDLAVVDDVIYAGGYFDSDSVDGETRQAAAAVDRQTGRLLAWNPRLGSSYAGVTAVTATPRAILLGGTFSTVRDHPRSNVAAVSPVTGAPLAWAPRITGGIDGGTVEELLEVGGRILVAGGFLTVNGTTHPYAALIEANGKTTRWVAGPAGAVRAVGYDGHRIALGGNFRGVGAVPRTRLAALDTRTGRVRAWAPYVSGEAVTALAADEQHLYIGGSFTSIGATQRKRLAAFERPSMRLAPWHIDVYSQDLGVDEHASVDTLAVAGSTLFIGGDFDHVGTQKRQALAAVDTPSQRVLAFDAALEANGLTRPMVRQLVDQNATLYAVGYLSLPDGAANDLAVLDDRTAKVRLSLEMWPDQLTIALAGQRLFLMGWFETVNREPRDSAAAVNTDNGALLPWQLRLQLDNGEDATAHTVAAAADWVILGGFFDTINGERRHGIAAVSATSPNVSPWHPLGELRDSLFVPAGETLYISSYNDAALAAFTPPQQTEAGTPP